MKVSDTRGLENYFLYFIEVIFVYIFFSNTSGCKISYILFFSVILVLVIDLVMIVRRKLVVDSDDTVVTVQVKEGQVSRPSSIVTFFPYFVVIFTCFFSCFIPKYSLWPLLTFYGKLTVCFLSYFIHIFTCNFSYFIYKNLLN